MASDQDDMAVMRRLAAVSARINHGHRLNDTLQAVADGVVEALGFGAAAVNYVLDDGDLQVLAVAGPQDARDMLSGQVTARAAMDGLLARGQSWGSLCFVSHEEDRERNQVEWVPDVEGPVGPDDWDSRDLLLAPLRDRDGTLIGVLSVDLPPGRRRPNETLCEMLAMFAVQAGVAIDNARLVEQLRLEHERLQASEAAFRFLFSASAGAMATISLDPHDLGRFLRVNEAFCRALGYSSTELTALTWVDLALPGERSGNMAQLLGYVRGEHTAERIERQMVRRDGQVIWAGLTTSTIAPDGTQSPFVLIHLEDITERKMREDTLIHQSHLDPLTGISNRRVLIRYLRSLLADPDAAPSGVVLYTDLDRFKRINDVHGHGVGDQVLRETAARLRAQVRAADVVARLGGDEFVVVAVDLDPPAARQLVERIRGAFSVPLAAVPEVVSISIGTADFDGTGRDVESLLHRADLAMYADKKRLD